MSRTWDAIVVGAGPNGLSAALSLAMAGHSVKVFEGQPTIGGGARSADLTRPGFVHDVCSAIHPLAAASPFFAQLELDKHGVEFVHPELPLAHPLDGGRAAVLERSVAATAARLGPDERAYLNLMRPFVERFEELKPLLFNPLTRPPLSSPVLAARFGLLSLRSAVAFAEETFHTDEARALLAGCAAHSFAPLSKPLTNAFSLVLAAAAHAVGWPAIRGGTQRLVDALAARFVELGGDIETNAPVTSLAQLPPSKLVLFDTHAHVMERVCGDALPAWYRHELTGFKLAPGAFKVDYALAGPMPWANADCHRAGTLHVGGTLHEVAASEAGPPAGVLTDRPYVLVAQQSRFDGTRAPAGQHTLWAYCHVPNGSDADATPRIEAQLERFAPGWRALVLERRVKTVRDFEATNASCVGGDISGGAVEGLQLFLRPTAFPPYRTPNPKVLLCSSSAPPGPGVHGMCGYWAAEVAKNRLRRRA